MPDNAEKLISMGLERFGQLTTAEVKLLRAVANGEVAEFRVDTGTPNHPDFGAANHPTYANRWRDDRWLRAERIAWLCGLSNTKNLLTERGILISGAKISGVLRLDYMVIDVPLAFSHCAFSDAISLQHAKARMLEFRLTHCKSINADGIQVDGLVRLKHGFQAFGIISLYGATINGDFECEYSRVFNPGEDAIRAIGLEVKGHIRLSYSKILGRVHLYQAKIGGNLDCYNTTIWNSSGEALLATGINVGGATFLSGIFATKGFVAIGSVNLNFATIGGNLDCENGRFIHRPKIRDRDAQVSALDLQCANIRGHVLLRNGFLSEGKVNLVNAIVGAHLDCQASRFLNPGGYAILGNNARISNGLILRNGFYAEGEIRLFATTIGGNLECSDGRFVNAPKNNALDAERAEVSGHVLLNGLFEADGAVRLYAAKIGGDLRCDGGKFVNPTGDALDMTRANVNGHVSMGNGFRAEGMVTLIRATIGGNLESLGGEFSCPEDKTSNITTAGIPLRCALQVESANIGGSVMLRPHLNGDNSGKPFVANGIVYLLDTRVGGNVEFQGCALLNKSGNALVLVAAQIAGNLALGPGFHAKGSVDLSRLRLGGVCYMFDFVEPEWITCLDIRFATVTTIQHAADSWPKAERLLLDGLEYKNVFVDIPFPGHWQKCLKWLRLQPTKPRSLQPYEQLARVLKMSGHELEATEVLIAKQVDLRRYGDLGWWAKLWNRVLGFSIGHGYKPHRAFLLMIYFVWLGAAIFDDGYRSHLITPSTTNYTKFQPFIYSLDCFLPIIDLKQKNEWSPNANNGYEIVNPCIGLRVRWGGLLRIYLCFHTLLGWALTTLWVAGFTGLVRRLN